MDKWQEILLSFYDMSSSTKVLARLIDIITLLTKCNNVALIRIQPNGSFFEAFTNVNNTVRKLKCEKTDFPCLPLITQSDKKPIIFNNENDSSALQQWQYIFPYRPYTVVLIPVEESATFTPAAALSYEVKTGRIASYAKILTIQQNIRVLLTYAMMVVKNEEDSTLLKAHNIVFSKAEQSLSSTDKADYCAKCVTWQTKCIVPCSAVIVFRIDLDTERLILCNTPHRLVGGACPLQYNHTIPSIEFHNTSPSVTPAVWTALNHKTIRINNLKQLEFVCKRTTLKNMHSVGGCVVNNVMAYIVKDLSNNYTLIVELSDSEDPNGFTEMDEYKLNIYSQIMAGVLSSSFLIEYYHRSIRRQEISSELIRNVYTVRKDQIQLFSMRHILTTKSMKFSYCVKSLSVTETGGLIFAIFNQLNLSYRWKIATPALIRFILSVQQGYRDLPYHNWFHACSVTHFLFLMIQNLKLVEKNFLRDIDVFSLIVAAITHDIDHRGTNNHFQLCTESDLYHMYKMEDSIMERHHFMHALGIMKRFDCNILENLLEDDLREFTNLLSWNILATDLSMHIKTRTRLFGLLNNYSINNEEQRKALMSCLMTMCDLSDSTKTWNDNLPTVKCVFQEFFAQGDLERSFSWIPLQMMDRRIAYIPQIELIFLNNIVRPVFASIAKCIPESKECLSCVDYCKELWLISTKIFDSVRTEDPLKVFNLPDIKEENLRKISNPDLLQMILEHKCSRAYSDILCKYVLKYKTLRIKDLKKNTGGRRSIFEEPGARGSGLDEETIVVRRQQFENEYMNSRAKVYRTRRATEGEEYAPNIEEYED